MSIKILSTGKCVPQKSVSNAMLSSIVDTNDEWITSRTGIINRFICTDESMTDLCATASLRALDKAALKASDIDMIICSTLGGDYITPSLACTVGERLGLGCPAFDINAACSGFIYALDLAALYIEAKKARNVLIVSAEAMSKYVDWSDRATCVLFGDGAGAAVVTAGNALKYINLTSTSNTKILNIPSIAGNSPFLESKEKTESLHMEGQEVFKLAVKMVEKDVALAFEKLKLSSEDVDYFILHQANKRIIESIRTRLKQPDEKFPTNISNYGNISSASIPILLDEMLDDGRIKSGNTLFLCAFGAGMTSGSAVMVWE